MKLRFIALIFLLAQFLAAPARIWQTDTLGLPFQVTYFSQPSDNVGPARSSLVRLLPEQESNPIYSRLQRLFLSDRNGP